MNSSKVKTSINTYINKRYFKICYPPIRKMVEIFANVKTLYHYSCSSVEFLSHKHFISIQTLRIYVDLK